jgi:hypothetical protein
MLLSVYIYHFVKTYYQLSGVLKNDFVYGELGRMTLSTTRHFRIIKYWLKVISSRENRLIHLAYKMMLDDLNDHPNKTNWASFAKTLLDNLGVSDAWLNQGVGDVNVFL